MIYVKPETVRRRLCGIIIGVVLSINICQSITADQLYDIDLVIEETMKCRRIPGISLTIVTEDDTVTRGYGLADVTTGIEADESTIFCVGSVGKAFTATLMAMIIDQHANLTWDTRVRDILPDFELQDPLRTSETTLRDLLSHRTGLQSGDLALQAGGGLNKDTLVSALKFLHEETPFRGKFVYNNMMYALIGHIAAFIEGQTFERMVSERIFKPLNMTSAVFVNSLNKYLDKLAKPYTLKGGKFQQIDLRTIQVVGKFPSTGGVCVSAGDMGQWLRFLLTGGRDIHGNYLVKERLLKDTMEEQMVLYGGIFSRKLRPRFPVSEINIAYGMGWIPSNYRGYARVHHSGSLWSYTSHAWMFPNEKVAGYLAINGPVGSGASKAMETTMAYISDILLGEEPWLNISAICSYPRPWEVYPEIRYNISNIIYTGPAKRPLESYMGTYYHPLYGKAVVKLSSTKDSQLDLSIGRFYKAKLFTLDSVDHFLFAFDGIYEFLTYSDDQQVIGSVVFTIHEEATSKMASSFILGLLDDGEYHFHRDVNHFNTADKIVLQYNSAEQLYLNLLTMMMLFIILMYRLDSY